MPSYNGQNLSSGPHSYGDLSSLSGQNYGQAWRSAAFAVQAGQNWTPKPDPPPIPNAPTGLNFDSASHRLSWISSTGAVSYRVLDGTDAVVGTSGATYYDIPRAWLAGTHTLKVQAVGVSGVSPASDPVVIMVTGAGLGEASPTPAPETPTIEGPFASLDYANQEILVHWKLHGTGWTAGALYIADAVTGVKLAEVNSYIYDVNFDALVNAFVLPVPATIFGKRVKVHFSAVRESVEQHKYSDAFTIPGTVSSSSTSSGGTSWATDGRVPGMGSVEASGDEVCSRRIDFVSALEFANRMRGVMPMSWLGTPDETPVINGLFKGWGATHRKVHDDVARLQSGFYLHTATGTALDALAADYFGDALTRRRLPIAGTSESVPESDASFRARIKQALLLPAGTPRGMRQAIQAAMGFTDSQALTNIILEDATFLSAGSTGGWAPGGTLDPGPPGGTGTLVIGTGPEAPGYGQIVSGVIQAMESYITIMKTPEQTWDANRISEVLHVINDVRPLGSRVFVRFL